MRLGESLEDYLECLLVLEKSGKIRSVDVARTLHVSKPSVNKAMHLLKEKGFITQENYGDIKLTDVGRKEASDILERHEFLKMFLTDILHVTSEQAEIDACKMEHAVSEETFDKLKEFYKNLKENN